MMSKEDTDLDAARMRAHDGAIGRWENEGGADAALDHDQHPTVVGQIGDVEAANLRVRLIALENVVVALLAGATDGQSALVREMARYIFPRPGMTPHRLIVEAARNMVRLVDRAAHYKNVEDIQNQ